MDLKPRSLPAPAVAAETEPYWQAAKRGELLIRRCTACGEAHHYPRALCPFCFGETVWEKTSGTGEIYSFSLMAKAEQPYAIAYVRLDDGPIMMTNLVDVSASDIAIGARVRVTFHPTEGDEPPLPTFSLL